MRWVSFALLQMAAVAVFFAFDALPFQDLPAHAGLIALRNRLASEPLEQRYWVLAPHLGGYSLFRGLGQALAANRGRRVRGAGHRRAAGSHDAGGSRLRPLAALPRSAAGLRVRGHDDFVRPHDGARLRELPRRASSRHRDVHALARGPGQRRPRDAGAPARAVRGRARGSGRARARFRVRASARSVCIGDVRRGTAARASREARRLLARAGARGVERDLRRRMHQGAGRLGRALAQRTADALSGAPRQAELARDPDAHDANGDRHRARPASLGLGRGGLLARLPHPSGSRRHVCRPHARAVRVGAAVLFVLFALLPHAVGWFAFVDGRLVPLVLALALLSTPWRILPERLRSTFESVRPGARPRLWRSFSRRRPRSSARLAATAKSWRASPRVRGS